MCIEVVVPVCRETIYLKCVSYKHEDIIYNSILHPLYTTMKSFKGTLVFGE